MGGVFKNQQIKSKLIMITMWKHRQNWQRKYTGRTSTTLKKLLLLMKNTMQNNADNQNNRENLQRLSFLKFKSIIDSYFYHFATRCMASLKVMI